MLEDAESGVPVADLPRKPGVSKATFFWLEGYDAAFKAKDRETLATFYHPHVTIHEGGGINDGWADCRDRHLGPS